MKKLIKIGNRNFSSKKEALLHYKNILNSYDFGQYLNEVDFLDLLSLLNYDYQNFSFQNEDIKSYDNELELYVKKITVSKVQFNTKCFEVFYSDNSSYYISYIMLINNKKYTPESLFYTACRNCIQSELIKVKQEYFKKNSANGTVKCQETNISSSWKELTVDHRQPNTLSVIIDRFIEVNFIKIDGLEYRTTKNNLIVFKDQNLIQEFISYHNSKATLRVVRKERNASRAAMGRVRKNSKDLTIHNSQLPLF